MFRNLNTKVLLVLALTVMSLASAAIAQQEVWTPNNESRVAIATDKAVSRESFPTEFKLFNLNFEPLRNDLMSVTDRNPATNKIVITLPNAAGEIEQFEVWETSNFDAELQALHPDIRAFTGQGITDRYATLKLSYSPQGVQGMVFRNAASLFDTSEISEYIEAYSKDHAIYAVFARSRSRGDSPWACSTVEKNMLTDLNKEMPMISAAPESNVGELKTMRLAQSNNGEYAGFFGASTACNATDKNTVLTAFNGTLTRANGVYEKDLAVHLNLIATTTNVIYCDPATDPYGTSISGWNAALQAALNANVGAANYDIGHMFGASGGGGNAGCIGCVCNDANKGSGITSPADGIPMGDNFDIDYVVHEVGHQMGANHSFSWSNEGSGVNMEVGSGITIMGYAGITSQDVAPHSIDTFHAGNIQQIQVNLASKTCPVTTVMTANHAPVVSPVSGVTIPISTPFALTASATDSDGDPLTYQWEQIDQTTTSGNASVASPTKTTGPNWLSFLPTASGTRTFPTLSTIQAGLFVTPTLPGGDAIANIEALSSVARTLNFRVTARDNKAYVPTSTIGQTNFTDVLVTVNASAGPFKVTSPNTGVSVAGGSATTVTWDVANTTAAPISTSNVKISFSNNGGATFPTVLAASTANDGSESVVIPVGLVNANARIKIEAIGNVYFDMSDVNFSVVAPPRSRADFDGDSKTDFSVFRPSGGDWYYQRSTAGFGVVHWGLSGDIPAPGDYDNDAKTDVAVARFDATPGNTDFYILNSATSTVSYISWGDPGDIPVVADYDGDSKSDVAVYRPSTGTWFILRTTAGVVIYPYGGATDIPMPGDFDGDAKTDIAFFRPGTGAVAFTPSSGGGSISVPLGRAATDLPVPADYSGDNRDELAFFTPATGNWYTYNLATNGTTNTLFGTSGDVPVPGDYDGDGKDDIGVYRSGAWYVQRSTAGFQYFGFGLSTDIPIPKKYIP